MNDFGKPARQAAVRKLIAVRAYELWENQGRPHGHHEINWHQAEQEIMSCIPDHPAAGTDQRFGQSGTGLKQSSEELQMSAAR
jgi:hypothetical protein